MFYIKLFFIALNKYVNRQCDLNKMQSAINKQNFYLAFHSFFILIKLDSNDPSKHLHFNPIEDRNSPASLLTYRLEKIEALVA